MSGVPLHYQFDLRPRRDSLTSSSDKTTKLAIEIFLKKMGNKKADTGPADIPITNRAPLNTLIHAAKNDEELATLKLDDFSAKPWVYQVGFSIFVYCNREILEKMREHYAANASTLEFSTLLATENAQIVNSYMVLVAISHGSDLIRELCLAVLDYYSALLKSRNSLPAAHAMSTTASELLMNVSKFRFTPEHINPNTDAIYNRLVAFGGEISTKRTQLDPVVEKQSVAATRPLSEPAIKIVKEILEVIQSATAENMDIKYKTLLQMDEKLYAMRQLAADEVALLREMLFFTYFGVRQFQPEKIPLNDKDHPTLPLLRNYNRFENFYRNISERLRKNGADPGSLLQVLIDSTVKTFVKVMLDRVGSALETNASNPNVAAAGLIGINYKFPVKKDVDNLNATNHEQIPEMLFALTVQKAMVCQDFSGKDMSKGIEQSIYLLARLLLTAPTLFVKYPRVVSMFIGLHKELLLAASTNEDVRLLLQADLRRFIEGLEAGMQTSTLEEQAALKPLMLDLHSLILDNIERATADRAAVEIEVYNSWILQRGHREDNTQTASGIIGWYGEIMAKLQAREIWIKRVQPQLTLSTPAEAVNAFLKVDLSHPDEAVTFKLKQTFDAVYRFHLALDAKIFYKDSNRVETWLRVLKEFHTLLEKQGDQNSRTYQQCIKDFIFSVVSNVVIPKLQGLTEKLQNGNGAIDEAILAELNLATNFVMRLIEVAAGLFKPHDKLSYVIAWSDYLYPRFPKQSLLHKQLNDKLDDLLYDMSEEVDAADGQAARPKNVVGV